MTNYRGRIEKKAATFQELLDKAPEAGVNSCRTIAESILGYIYRDEYDKEVETLDFDRLLGTLRSSKKGKKNAPIKHNVETYFLTIQTIGNRNSHVHKVGSELGSARLKKSEIKRIKIATLRLLEWFDKTYHQTYTIPSGRVSPKTHKKSRKPNSTLKVKRVSRDKPNKRSWFKSLLRFLFLTVTLAVLSTVAVIVILKIVDPFPMYSATPIEWISIKGGVFEMGSASHDPDEQPVHQVRIPSFEISRAEITIAQYAACIEAGICSPPHEGTGCNWGHPERANHPVNCLDWSEARAFAEWAGGRLPSEAEWEYAARSGGRNIHYPWGRDEPSCDRAIFSMRGYPHKAGHGCNERSTWPVCSKPRGVTADGVCDMAGNVWEWVEDEKCSYPSEPRDARALRCDSPYMVLRGGSWANNGHNLRVNERLKFKDPGNQYVGFRVAR